MLTTSARFQAAIQNFMRSAEYSARKPKLRARVFLEDVEPGICQLKILELIEMAFRAEERKEARASENVYQMFLPGFASLEEKLPLRNGKIALAKATITSLEETLIVIRKKIALRPDITRVQTLIDEMRPYLEGNPGLTVERYCELRAAGVEAGAKPKAARAAASK